MNLRSPVATDDQDGSGLKTGKIEFLQVLEPQLEEIVKNYYGMLSLIKTHLIFFRGIVLYTLVSKKKKNFASVMHAV